jgi:hypothetical protein
MRSGKPIYHSVDQDQHKKTKLDKVERTEGSSKFPSHLKSFERQRNEFFNSLIEITSEELDWYADIINWGRERPSHLKKLCVSPPDESKFILTPSNKSYKPLIEKHATNCLYHITFMGMLIRDMVKVYEYNSDEKTPLLQRKIEQQEVLSSKENDPLLHLIHSISIVSRHLTAISMLKNKEKYLLNKEYGAKQKALKVTKNEEYNIIKTLVKLLLNNEKYSKEASVSDDLVQRHTDEIMKLWDSWQFFKYKEPDLKDTVEQILNELKVKEVVARSAYVRKRGFPMRRPPKETKPLCNEISDARLMWQKGLVDALTVILKSKFGDLTEKQMQKIESASPEIIKIWLTQASKYTQKPNKNADEILIKI